MGTIVDPPAECQHTTVTKNNTFYTTTASDGHIIKLTTAADWTSHLGNLPEESKWVFIHSNLKETRPTLAATLACKPTIAVSDGSFKDTQGTATWVMYTESAPKTAIAHGVLMTTGQPNSQGSYRSKLAGIYGIVTTITMICKFYQTNQGSVQVICNGESTLKCCFKQPVCNPTKKHFDILHTIRTTMQETSIKWQWEHIHGHQDASAIASSDKACWNDAMDKVAKNIGKQSKTILTPQSYPSGANLGDSGKASTRSAFMWNATSSNIFVADQQKNTGKEKPALPNKTLRQLIGIASRPWWIQWQSLKNIGLQSSLQDFVPQEKRWNKLINKTRQPALNVDTNPKPWHISYNAHNCWHKCNGTSK